MVLDGSVMKWSVVREGCTIGFLQRWNEVFTNESLGELFPSRWVKELDDFYVEKYPYQLPPTPWFVGVVDGPWSITNIYGY